MVQTGVGPEPQGAPPCQLPLASAFGPRLTRAPPQKYASKPANSRTFSRVVVAQTRTLAVSSCVVVAQTRTLAVSSSAVAVDCLSPETVGQLLITAINSRDSLPGLRLPYTVAFVPRYRASARFIPHNPSLPSGGSTPGSPVYHNADRTSNAR